MTNIRAYGPNCNGCRREGTHALLVIDGTEHYLSRAQLMEVRRSLDDAMGAFGTVIEFRAMGQTVQLARTESTRLQEQIEAVMKERRTKTFDERRGL
jgi:hypothetical protein